MDKYQILKPVLKKLLLEGKNKTYIARSLNISRVTLYKYIERFNKENNN